MVLLSDRASFQMAVLFYGLSMVYSIFLWRRGFRQDNRVNYVVLGLGFVAHTLAMFQRGFRLDRCPVNNLYEATTFVAWTIAAVYLAVGLWRRFRFLGVFASPFLFALGVFALMPGMDPPTDVGPRFTHGWTSLHMTLVLLACGAFGLSSVSAAMYLAQQHDLKLHKFRAFAALMPPIQRLELITGRLLVTGFWLLTTGMVFGAAWFHGKEEVHVSRLKLVWSAIVWLIYFLMLLVRWRLARGGRRFAWGAIASFAFVMLTFWGVYLLVPVPR